ncbi:MAG: methyltransferase domain-containing protein [Desulfobacteraceae bacterium]|nr:MAG: methyltransferase domain-containing protein [Desulfobacteraceae bacterium]
MFSIEFFHKNYETDVCEAGIRGRKFRFFRPRYIEPFVASENPLHDFPLWCKIWEPSLFLADHLASIVPEPGKRFLEIGGGLGLVSVVASSFGHTITMTEHIPDALAFARANAMENGCSDLEIVDLDWNDFSMKERFDCIVGSEIVYSERDFDPLERLFGKLLKPDGEVLLVSGVRKTSIAFFARMQEIFQVKGQKKTLRSASKEFPLILCTMKPRQQG